MPDAGCATRAKLHSFESWAQASGPPVTLGFRPIPVYSAVIDGQSAYRGIYVLDMGGNPRLTMSNVTIQDAVTGATGAQGGGMRVVPSTWTASEVEVQGSVLGVRRDPDRSYGFRRPGAR